MPRGPPRRGAKGKASPELRLPSKPKSRITGSVRLEPLYFQPLPQPQLRQTAPAGLQSTRNQNRAHHLPISQRTSPTPRASQVTCPKRQFRKLSPPDKTRHSQPRRPETGIQRQLQPLHPRCARLPADRRRNPVDSVRFAPLHPNRCFRTFQIVSSGPNNPPNKAIHPNPCCKMMQDVASESTPQAHLPESQHRMDGPQASPGYARIHILASFPCRRWIENAGGLALTGRNAAVTRDRTACLSRGSARGGITACRGSPGEHANPRLVAVVFGLIRPVDGDT